MVQRSFTSLLKKVETDLDLIRTEFLKSVAEDLVNISPVDTGNYVSNHSITTSTGSGGKTNSHGKPKDDGTAKEKALTKLNEQIDSLPPDATKVFIANRSPYANKVEYLGWQGKTRSTSAYYVFTSVRNRASVHLQDAINKVRGSR
jgi:hypothetical protein